MKKKPKVYTDKDGREWKHGDRREDGYVFRTMIRGTQPCFISQAAYDRLIAGNIKRDVLRRSEKKIQDRKKVVHHSMVSDRIRKEVMDLHVRGKDVFTIALRLHVPASAVQIIIEALSHSDAQSQVARR